MPRKGPAPRRDLNPDPLYRSVLVTQLVNKVLLEGKRSVSEKIVYDALRTVADKSGGDPIVVLKRAIDNVKPALEVRSRRVGGATYQVPVDIRAERRTSLAMRWLVRSARARRGRSMAEKLAGELMDASSGQGSTVKRREDTHRMAEANRAFAHYRW